jgi:UDP-N-acetyl-L-fucosamine synthase
MNKLKVMTVVGTRPEIIRLSRVMARLDEDCNHIIVHTGQNYDYELNEIFFEDLSVRKPDFFLESAGLSGAQTIGKVIINIDKLLDDEKPDALLVLGDTNSCLSVIPAKRKKIPIFHMEAGNRCFDQRVPEELNRKIVDHTSDINMPYSSIAREYLLREGVNPDTIVKTGSPMYEVLTYYKKRILESNVLNELNIKKYGYFLISAHREENISSTKNFKKLVEVLNTLAETYDQPVIVSTHPRTKKQIDLSKVNLHSNISLMKPLSFSNYNFLQINSKAVLSDSGTISEESYILNFPALNLREAHERPEAMEEAAVMMVGLNINRIIQSLNILDSTFDRNNSAINIPDYNIDNVSKKVSRIIHSYTDYVNRVTWKKY